MKSLACLAAVCLFGCGPQAGAPSKEGGGIISNVQKNVTTLQVQKYLENIGLLYQTAAVGGSPPRNLEELGLEGKWQKSPRDQQPFEIIYGVDPGKQDASKQLLAWEKTTDKDGGRCVLMADCRTLGYMKEDEFKSTPRAKGR